MSEPHDFGLQEHMNSTHDFTVPLVDCPNCESVLKQMGVISIHTFPPSIADNKEETTDERS